MNDLTIYDMQCGAIRGMLPVWLSPRQGWRFRLVRYTGILYLGYAVKRAEESSSYAVSSRAETQTR